MHIVRLAQQLLTDMLFPQACIACGGTCPDPVCVSCLSTIIPLEHAYCPVCLRRASLNHSTCHSASFLLLATTDYDQEIVKQLIWQYKYEGWENIAPIIARMMTHRLIAHGVTPMSPWIIIPLPLYPSKERKRGFNQSALVSKYVSEALSIPWHNEYLARTRLTLSQAEMSDFESRERNVCGAFHLHHPELLTGKRVILVDDVFTSGATLSEASRVLKSAGVKEIIGLVFAKAR